MPIWNDKTPTDSELAAVEATADAAIVADTRPNTSGHYAMLSMRPWGSVLGTGTLVKDSWRATLTHLRSSWTVSGLAVLTTGAASGGTAALMFGIWARDPVTGRPGAKMAAFDGLGTLDLTAAPGTLVLATPGLIVPAGEFFVGVGWAGTATTSPVLGTHAGLSAGTDSSTSNNTGYVYAASGAAVPNPFVAGLGTTAGTLVLVRIV